MSSWYCWLLVPSSATRHSVCISQLLFCRENSSKVLRGGFLAVVWIWQRRTRCSPFSMQSPTISCASPLGTMSENVPFSASSTATFLMSCGNGRHLLLRAKARPLSSGKVSSVKNGGLQRIASKGASGSNVSTSFRMHSIRLQKGL